MKLIFSLISLLVPASAMAAHPWQDVVGCYKTLSDNGAAVDTNGAQSSFKDVDDLAVIHDAKGGVLGGLEMMIIQGYDKAKDEMKIDYQAAVTNLGTYSTSQDTPPIRSYSYDGLIRFQDMPPMRVKQNVSVQWKSNTQLLLHTKRVVVGTGGTYDTDDTYLLEKQTCTQ